MELDGLNVAKTRKHFLRVNKGDNPYTQILFRDVTNVDHQQTVLRFSRSNAVRQRGWEKHSRILLAVNETRSHVIGKLHGVYIESIYRFHNRIHRCGALLHHSLCVSVYVKVQPNSLEFNG